MWNDPPISTSSPRETIVSRARESVADKPFSYPEHNMPGLALAQLLQPVRQIFPVGELLAMKIKDQAAGVGEPDRPAPPLDQRDAERGLKLSDLAADRGNGDANLLACKPHRTEAGGLKEIMKGIVPHTRSFSPCRIEAAT